jgi:hypothetical protein
MPLGLVVAQVAGPGRLCTQCIHNRFIRGNLSKADDMVQVAAVISSPVVRNQLSRQRRDNGLPLLGEFVGKSVTA